MHIHGPMTGINAANFNGAAHNERADASRRAADTRRKLAMGASSSADSLSDDETFLVVRWLGADPNDPLPGDEYRGSSESHGKPLA